MKLVSLFVAGVSLFAITKTAFAESSGSMTPSSIVVGTSEAFGQYLSDSFSGGLDPARGYEAALFGGWSSLGEGNKTYQPRSVLIQSDPYGPFSNGCGLGISTTGINYTSQFPVSEVLPYGANGSTAAQSVVNSGAFDRVASCILTSNTPARLVLTAKSYTRDSVILSTPLTSAQAALIHPFMYITTNSPNPDLHPQSSSDQLPPRNLYAGFVSSQPKEGDANISVYAWDVPKFGTGKADQVPQTKTLDTTFSAYSQPTVFLGGGAAYSTFAHNEFFNIQASDLTPSATNRSLIRQFTADEVDLNIVGTAPKHSVYWTGINMNAGNQPDALTKDSHQLFIGGVINHHLIIDGGCGDWDIETQSVKIPQSQCGIDKDVTARISQEWTQYVSGANNMRFDLWDSLDNPNAPVGWQQAVVHLGPTVDEKAHQTGAPGGSRQGDIEWNWSGNYGGITLCGYGKNCGFLLDGNGQAHLMLSELDAQKGVTIGAGERLKFTPSSNSKTMTPALYAPNSHQIALTSNTKAAVSFLATGDLETNNGGSSITSGLHADGNGNLTVLNETSGTKSILSAAYFIGTLTTPASSSAPCTPGQFTDDANYHYVCVAQNHWKRVALSSF